MTKLKREIQEVRMKKPIEMSIEISIEMLTDLPREVPREVCAFPLRKTIPVGDYSYKMGITMVP